jgi:hypothetical protein
VIVACTTSGNSARWGTYEDVALVVKLRRWPSVVQATFCHVEPGGPGDGPTRKVVMTSSLRSAAEVGSLPERHLASLRRG